MTALYFSKVDVVANFSARLINFPTINIFLNFAEEVVISTDCKNEGDL